MPVFHSMPTAFRQLSLSFKLGEFRANSMLLPVHLQSRCDIDRTQTRHWPFAPDDLHERIESVCPKGGGQSQAMSKPIVVSIPHHLGKDEALRRLKPGLTGAAKSFPVLKVDEEIWSGDRLTFRVRALGQAAAGTVDVAEDHVRLEVTLPWLLQKFAEVAQTVIRARGKLLLEKK